jgi:hypothetical protein
MSGLSKVIVLDPDARASRQIQLGFERAGIPAAIVTGDGAIPVAEAGLVVIGGNGDATRALELIRRTRGALANARADVPIVFVGQGVRRADAVEAGADETVLAPAYLRDVVTVGRLLRGLPSGHRAHIAGNLAEITGVYSLVRALAALGRSAVLTLIRGLRRGEIRFYHGEVTSAQVGMIHGQAALHQLLLWTDARFDFEHEDVVRRQQIPLEPDELFADAERFLTTIRAESGVLSPAMVLEQDIGQIQANAKHIPTEVHGVLRMFDGYRSLADVLEDSPYRVFETLRVTQLAVAAALLREIAGARPRSSWHAMLSIEEWLIGATNPAASGAVVPVAREQSGTVRVGAKDAKSKKEKRKKKRADTPVPVARPTTDWGALVPRVVGAEVGQLAGVVPVAHAAGEIDLTAATRGVTRSEPSVRLEKVIWEPASEPTPVDPVRVPFEPDADPAPVIVIEHEPSDGVIRDRHGALDTGPKRRGPPRASAPLDAAIPDDRPPETTGEITAPRVTPLAIPAPTEPSILIADLGAVHTSIAAVATAQAVAPPTADAASPVKERAVEAVRSDATVAFSDLEEDFFRREAEAEVRAAPVPKPEVFADLDEDYQHVGFWDRLFGRKKPRRGD